MSVCWAAWSVHRWGTVCHESSQSACGWWLAASSWQTRSLNQAGHWSLLARLFLHSVCLSVCLSLCVSVFHCLSVTSPQQLTDAFIWPSSLLEPVGKVQFICLCLSVFLSACCCVCCFILRDESTQLNLWSEPAGRVAFTPRVLCS